MENSNKLVPKSNNNELQTRTNLDVEDISEEELNFNNFRTAVTSMLDFFRTEIKEKNKFKRQALEMKDEVGSVKRKMTEQAFSHKKNLEAMKNEFKDMNAMLSTYIRHTAKFQENLEVSLNTSFNEIEDPTSSDISIQDVSVITPVSQKTIASKLVGSSVSSTPRTNYVVTSASSANKKNYQYEVTGVGMEAKMDFALKMILEMRQEISTLNKRNEENDTFMREYFFRSETVTEFTEFLQIKKEHHETFIKNEPPRQALPSRTLTTMDSSCQTEPYSLKNEVCSPNVADTKPVLADLQKNLSVKLRKCEKCIQLFNPGVAFRNHMIENHKADLTCFCIGCAKLYVSQPDLQAHRRNCPLKNQNSKNERLYWIRTFHNSGLESIVKDRNIEKIYEIYKRFKYDITRVKYSREQFVEAEKSSLEKR